MGKLVAMVVFVWSLSILFFLGQTAMINLNPESVTFCNMTGSVVSQHIIAGSISMPDSNSISSELDPTIADSGAQETDNIIPFVDAIASVKSWIQNKINYFVAIIMAPYNILSCIKSLPQDFVTAIALIWYAVSIIVLILVIFGRTD